MSIATESPSKQQCNIGARLTEMAAKMPNAVAVVMTDGKKHGKYNYRQVTFAELEEDSNRIAAGLMEMGVRPGTRLALMVKPSIDFVSLTFALFKASAVTILIDPGMGKDNLLLCLEEVQPQGFVAISLAHALRIINRHRFPAAKQNVTVGRRWFWGGPTLKKLRETSPSKYQPIATSADDPAAIIFTTGSTGPPKGVLFEHGTFAAQVDQIQERYDIQPGGVDLAGFPLFGLFNAAMGMTTVIPDMDASRPASVDPQAIVSAVEDWKITQSFASPSVWNVVGRYCEENDLRLPTLKRVLSAGAPVPNHVLARLKRVIHDEGDIFTPYGATESLPIASISASEVLNDTGHATASGSGTCVGRRYSAVDWKVIRIVDGPIETLDQVEEIPRGEVGELIVAGPMVTKRYVTRVAENALAKIDEHGRIWHRIGDVGYLDDQERFWFCGRKAHRVQTSDGVMYTVPCEAIFNNHPGIFRSALVGVGKVGEHRPVMICEPENWTGDESEQEKLIDELHGYGQDNWLTNRIRREDILLHESLPVDIRHNAKIFREKLSVWAKDKLS